MNRDREIRFLTIELVRLIHHRSLVEHGGIDGTRDPAGAESALAAGVNAWFYRGGDVFDVAAAYAFHLAEAQAFLDGNKRTAIASALFFLAANGVRGIPHQGDVHDAMIALARHELGKAGLTALLRKQFPQT